jgi:hypothetical protein
MGSPPFQSSYGLLHSARADYWQLITSRWANIIHTQKPANRTHPTRHPSHTIHNTIAIDQQYKRETVGCVGAASPSPAASQIRVLIYLTKTNDGRRSRSAAHPGQEDTVEKASHGLWVVRVSIVDWDCCIIFYVCVILDERYNVTISIKCIVWRVESISDGCTYANNELVYAKNDDLLFCKCLMCGYTLKQTHSVWIDGSQLTTLFCNKSLHECWNPALLCIKLRMSNCPSTTSCALSVIKILKVYTVLLTKKWHSCHSSSSLNHTSHLTHKVQDVQS